MTVAAGMVRRLHTIADDHGLFTILAVDHRDSLRVEFDADAPDDVDPAVLTRFKLDLVRAVGSRASAVLLDPEYSVGQAVLARAVRRDVAVLAAVEEQGYLGDAEARTQVLLEDWGVEKAARLGVAGVKLLVLYRPDRGAATSAQEDLVREVVEACAANEVPLFCEPVPYDLDGDDDRRRVVVRSAERMAALGAHVLKLPFPVGGDDGWADACAELDAAAGRPWALLSWGAPYEVFRDQLAAACDAGASGFLVGRALWRPALEVDGRGDALRDVVIPRFEELTAIAHRHGRPWHDAADLPDPAVFDHRTY